MNKVLNRVLSSIHQADKNSLWHKNNQDLPLEIKGGHQLFGGKMDFTTRKLHANSYFVQPGEVGFGTQLFITSEHGLTIPRTAIDVEHAHSLVDWQDFPKDGNITFESWKGVGSCLQVWTHNWKLLAILSGKEVTVPSIPFFESRATFEIVV